MSPESDADTFSTDASPMHPPVETGHFQTFPDIPIGNLSDAQLQAIELSVRGLSDIAVSQRLYISTKTLWRWKTFHAEYRAALANARYQVHAAATDRYHLLLNRAWNVLATNLDATEQNLSFRAAQSLLHMAGAFKPTEPAAPKPTEDDKKERDWPEPMLEPKVG
jgi:hypothetical protein